MNKSVLLYAVIIIFGLAAPFVFPAFKVQLSILCVLIVLATTCLLYTSPSPRDRTRSRMPSSA